MSYSVRPHRRQPARLHRPWDSPGKNTGVGCHFLLQCMKVKSEREVAQSCLTLRDPMDCSPPGSSVHGILQARILEWVAISFSTTQYYSAIKKNEIVPFAATRMDLESVVLNEVSQRRRNVIWHPLYVESKKKWYKWTYKTTRLWGLAYGCQGEGWLSKG